MEFESTQDDGDDTPRIIEHLENALRLARTGNIDGLVIFSHHTGDGGGQSHVHAGLRHFNATQLATMARVFFDRLDNAWYDHEVKGVDALRPRLTTAEGDAATLADMTRTNTSWADRVAEAFPYVVDECTQGVRELADEMEVRKADRATIDEALGDPEAAMVVRPKWMTDEMLTQMRLLEGSSLRNPVSTDDLDIAILNALADCRRKDASEWADPWLLVTHPCGKGSVCLTEVGSSTLAAIEAEVRVFFDQEMKSLPKESSTVVRRTSEEEAMTPADAQRVLDRFDQDPAL